MIDSGLEIEAHRADPLDVFERDIQRAGRTVLLCVLSLALLCLAFVLMTAFLWTASAGLLSR